MRKLSAQDRGFLLGIIYAAWHLNWRGDDVQAQELIENAGEIEQLERLARREQYRFHRGFWSGLKRDRALARARIRRAARKLRRGDVWSGTI